MQTHYLASLIASHRNVWATESLQTYCNRPWRIVSRNSEKPHVDANRNGSSADQIVYSVSKEVQREGWWILNEILNYKTQFLKKNN